MLRREHNQNEDEDGWSCFRNPFAPIGKCEETRPSFHEGGLSKEPNNNQGDEVKRHCIFLRR